jgi:hypothetical protein
VVALALVVKVVVVMQPHTRDGRKGGKEIAG